MRLKSVPEKVSYPVGDTFGSVAKPTQFGHGETIRCWLPPFPFIPQGVEGDQAVLGMRGAEAVPVPARAAINVTASSTR